MKAIQSFVNTITKPYYTSIEGSAWAWLGYEMHGHSWLRWLAVAAIVTAPVAGWQLRRLVRLRPAVVPRSLT